jgi:predicted membrane protein
VQRPFICTKKFLKSFFFIFFFFYFFNFNFFIFFIFIFLFFYIYLFLIIFFIRHHNRDTYYGCSVDHANQNKVDNRKNNLIERTISFQNQNRGKFKNNIFVSNIRMVIK